MTESRPVWRSLLISATSPASLSLIAVALPLVQLLPAGPARTLASGLLALGLLELWRRRREAPPKQAQVDAAGPASDFVPVEDPIRWSFMPSTGALRANTQEAVQSTNDLASLKFMVLHRPTHEPWREAGREYPYAWHFSGRKRIWEVRVQVRFKRLPDGPIYFGLEMRHGSGSTKGFAKGVKNVLLGLIRGAIGNEFYQTAGDDPAKVEGEAEPPTFAMPLWVVDQFIISDPAEAPDLSSDLTGLGARRTDGMKKYIAAMRDMLDTLNCDKVYTFAFWGISQFIDVMGWNLHMPGGLTICANKLCGVAPVYVVAYQLARADEGEEADTRHLISKKSYYFKVALWSDKKPPEDEFLEDLLGGASPQQPCAGARRGGGAVADRGSSRFARLAEANARWRVRAKARRERALRRLISMFGECGGGQIPRET